MQPAAASTPEPEDGAAGGRRSGTLRTIATLAVGAALIAWLLRDAGLHHVWDHFRRLGWLAGLVFVPYAIIAYFDARGWSCTLSEESRRKVPLYRMYLVRMAGEAVNSVTPTAAVGGEPVKALLLRRWGVPGGEAVASLVLTKTALTVSQSLFVVVGLAALFDYLNLRWLGAGLLLVLLGLCGAFAYALVRLQRNDPAATVWRWLSRVMPRARFVERLSEKVGAVDDHLREFYQGDWLAFRRAASWHMLGWFTGVWEIHMLLDLIGNPVSWQYALIIEALAQPIRATSIIVPGALGTQEVGGAAVCSFLGIPEAAGVTLWLLKRARELVFDGAGLLYLLPQTAHVGRR